MEGETFDSSPYIFYKASIPSLTVVTVSPEVEFIVCDSGRGEIASMNGLEWIVMAYGRKSVLLVSFVEFMR